jgi:hypothetical protein
VFSKEEHRTNAQLRQARGGHSHGGAGGGRMPRAGSALSDAIESFSVCGSTVEEVVCVAGLSGDVSPAHASSFAGDAGLGDDDNEHPTAPPATKGQQQASGRAFSSRYSSSSHTAAELAAPPPAPRTKLVMALPSHGVGAGFRDGACDVARFRCPSSVGVRYGDKSVFVADAGNNVVRRVVPNGGGDGGGGGGGISTETPDFAAWVKGRVLHVARRQWRELQRRRREMRERERQRLAVIEAADDKARSERQAATIREWELRQRREREAGGGARGGVAEDEGPLSSGGADVGAGGVSSLAALAEAALPVVDVGEGGGAISMDSWLQDGQGAEGRGGGSGRAERGSMTPISPGAPDDDGDRRGARGGGVEGQQRQHHGSLVPNSGGRIALNERSVASSNDFHSPGQLGQLEQLDVALGMGVAGGSGGGVDGDDAATTPRTIISLATIAAEDERDGGEGQKQARVGGGGIMCGLDAISKAMAGAVDTPTMKKPRSSLVLERSRIAARALLRPPISPEDSVGRGGGRSPSSSSPRKGPLNALSASGVTLGSPSPIRKYRNGYVGNPLQARMSPPRNASHGIDDDDDGWGGAAHRRRSPSPSRGGRRGGADREGGRPSSSRLSPPSSPRQRSLAKARRNRRARPAMIGTSSLSKSGRLRRVGEQESTDGGGDRRARRSPSPSTGSTNPSSNPSFKDYAAAFGADWYGDGQSEVASTLLEEEYRSGVEEGAGRVGGGKEPMVHGGGDVLHAGAGGVYIDHMARMHDARGAWAPPPAPPPTPPPPSEPEENDHEEYVERGAGMGFGPRVGGSDGAAPQHNDIIMQHHPVFVQPPPPQPVAVRVSTSPTRDDGARRRRGARKSRAGGGEAMSSPGRRRKRGTTANGSSKGGGRHVGRAVEGVEGVGHRSGRSSPGGGRRRRREEASRNASSRNDSSPRRGRSGSNSTDAAAIQFATSQAAAGRGVVRRSPTRRSRGGSPRGGRKSGRSPGRQHGRRASPARRKGGGGRRGSPQSRRRVGRSASRVGGESGDEGRSFHFTLPSGREAAGKKARNEMELEEGGGGGGGVAAGGAGSGASVGMVVPRGGGGIGPSQMWQNETRARTLMTVKVPVRSVSEKAAPSRLAPGRRSGEQQSQLQSQSQSLRVKKETPASARRQRGTPQTATTTRTTTTGARRKKAARQTPRQTRQQSQQQVPSSRRTGGPTPNGSGGTSFRMTGASVDQRMGNGAFTAYPC